MYAKIANCFHMIYKDKEVNSFRTKDMFYHTYSFKIMVHQISSIYQDVTAGNSVIVAKLTKPINEYNIFCKIASGNNRTMQHTHNHK